MNTTSKLCFLLALIPGLFPTGCRAKADIQPLPPGAAELHQKFLTFETLRAWISCGLLMDQQPVPSFGHQFVLAIRDDGTVVVDNTSQRERFRWNMDGVTLDLGNIGNPLPPDHFEYFPRPYSPWSHTVPLVQEAVLRLRDPDVEWLPRGPGDINEEWARPGARGYTQLILPELESLGYRIFLRFSPSGGLRYISVVNGIGLDEALCRVARLEFDAPLPASAFQADVPEWDLTWPDFHYGVPRTPFPPEMYASPNQVPPASFAGNESEILEPWTGPIPTPQLDPDDPSASASPPPPDPGGTPPPPDPGGTPPPGGSAPPGGTPPPTCTTPPC